MMNKIRTTLAVIAASALMAAGAASTGAAQAVTPVADSTATGELRLYEMQLKPAVPVSDIEDRLIDAPVRIEAIEHVGASAGVMHPGGDDLASALSMYRVTNLEQFDAEPLVSTIRYRAYVAADLSIPEASIAAVKIVDEAALADLVSSQNLEGDREPSQAAGADPAGDVVAASTENPWAPSEGLIRAKNSTTSAGYPRQMIHRHMWNSRAGLNSYDDFAYEHDMKLYDRSTGGGTRPYCTNNDFWAIRGNDPSEGGSTFVSSDMPPSVGLYLDTDVSDTCETMDFSWGIYHPDRLTTNVSYKTVVGAQKGPLASSIFELTGQRLSNDCQFLPDNPNCIGLNERRDGTGSQLYVNDTRAWRVPDCYTWLRGASPTRNC